MMLNWMELHPPVGIVGLSCVPYAGIVFAQNNNTYSHTFLQLYHQTHTHTDIHPFCSTFHPLSYLMFIVLSRLLSVYSDWSQCVSSIRHWLCSQNEDFHSCWFLVGFFPLSHLNWLLLLPKLAVTFCIFVLGLTKPVYLRINVQLGKFKQRFLFRTSLCSLRLWKSPVSCCFTSKNFILSVIFIIVKAAMKIIIAPKCCKN